MATDPIYNIKTRLDRLGNSRRLRIRSQFLNRTRVAPQTWANYVEGKTDIPGRHLKTFSEIFDVTVDCLYTVNNPKCEL